MELKWANIKEYVYIATIILSIGYHFIDEAKEKATVDADMKHMAQELKEVNKKLDKYGDYWLEQKEVNGAIITALSLDVE